MVLWVPARNTDEAEQITLANLQGLPKIRSSSCSTIHFSSLNSSSILTALFGFRLCYC